MFFGPSKEFALVFKAALLCSVEWSKQAGQQSEVQRKFSIQNEPLFDQIILNMVMG